MKDELKKEIDKILKYASSPKNRKAVAIETKEIKGLTGDVFSGLVSNAKVNVGTIGKMFNMPVNKVFRLCLYGKRKLPFKHQKLIYLIYYKEIQKMLKKKKKK